MRLRLVPLLAVLLLAGCAATPEAPKGTPQDDSVVAVLARAFAFGDGHDHGDASQHDASWGLEEAGRLARADLLGGETARVSDFQVHEGRGLAAVAVNGGSGGFVLLDASTPPDLRALGRYRSGSEDNWYVKFTDDGRHVLLTANGALSPARSAAGVLAGVTEGVATGPARGLQVVDVSDPAAPRLVGHWPEPIRVINAATHTRDGGTLVFASVTQDRLAANPGGALSNHVLVLRLVETPGGLVRLDEIARWKPREAGGAEAFPHDLAVERHPITGQLLLYAAWWDAGAFLVDVSDPAQPVEVARLPGEEGDHVDTVKPHPGLVEGRHLTLLAPESFAGEPSGAYRLYDTTDPTRPVLRDAWTPPGDLHNDEHLLWSPHEFTLAEGNAWISQFHAGAGVLDLSGGQLTPVAWWARGTPADGTWSVDVETFVRHGGYAYAVDMEGGVIVFAPSSSL